MSKRSRAGWLTFLLIGLIAVTLKLNHQQLTPLFEYQLSERDQVAVAEILIRQGEACDVDEWGRILVPSYLRSSLQAQLVLEGLPLDRPTTRVPDVPGITKDTLKNSQADILSLALSLPQVKACEVELSEPRSMCICDFRPAIVRMKVKFHAGESLTGSETEALVRIMDHLAPMRSLTDVSIMAEGVELNPIFEERFSPHSKRAQELEKMANP